MADSTYTMSEKTYIAAVGRRKESVARIQMYKGKGFEVNGKKLEEFFTDNELPGVVLAPLHLIGDNAIDSYKVTVKVSGGGKRGQAEAIRLGISRALQIHDPELRGVLKKAGFLKRDPRAKERKKPGLKKARRAPQFSKR